MVLDGTMLIIACTALTVLHPGVAFGDVWQEANFHFRTKRYKTSGAVSEDSEK